MVERMELEQELLRNIKSNLPEIKALLAEVSSGNIYQEAIYRFYYQSFKVYFLQYHTSKIVSVLQNLKPKQCTLSLFFQAIVVEGAAGKKFELLHNKEWLIHTRPIVEAFLHCKFFLEVIVSSGELLDVDDLPTLLPYDWAAVLCLYGLR